MVVQWTKSCFCTNSMCRGGWAWLRWYSGGVACRPITRDSAGARRPIAIEQQTRHEWLRMSDQINASERNSVELKPAPNPHFIAIPDSDRIEACYVRCVFRFFSALIHFPPPKPPKDVTNRKSAFVSRAAPVSMTDLMTNRKRVFDNASPNGRADPPARSKKPSF